MSLINDALKRANQAQKQRPPVGPLGVPLKPADSAPTGPWLPVALVTAGLLIALAGAVGLIWFGWRSIREPAAAAAVASPPPAFRSEVKGATVQTPARAVVKAVPKPAVPVQPAPVVREVSVAQPPPIPPKPTPVVTEGPRDPPPAPPLTAAAPVAPPVPVAGKPDTVSSPASTPTAAVVLPKPAVVTVAPPPPPPKPAFPELKLQGIFYLASRPSALISGKTVFLGDTVRGAKVVNIEKLNVTLEFAGENKVLSLE